VKVQLRVVSERVYRYTVLLRYISRSAVYTTNNSGPGSGAAIEAGAAAEVAASRKEFKCANLDSRYISLSRLLWRLSLGVFNSSDCLLLNEIGERISVNTGKSRETGYLFQRASVLVQRFNAILLHNTLPAADCTD